MRQPHLGPKPTLGGAGAPDVAFAQHEPSLTGSPGCRNWVSRRSGPGGRYSTAMCGRYSITTPVEALARLFRFTGPLPNLRPRYNVAPMQQVPIVRRARSALRASAEQAQHRS